MGALGFYNAASAWGASYLINFALRADLNLTGLDSARDFGELQQDWADEWESFCQLDLSGMRVALFGVGDQLGYPEWFQDSLGLIANQVRKAGGVLVAPWPNQGYKFEASLALMEGEDQFVGLALDEDSQAWATDERLEVWLKQVQLEFS